MSDALHARDLDVLAGYDLGQVHDVSTLKGGMFLKPILVTADTGKYVLRAHTFRTTAQAFRFQAEVVAFAASHGVLCPAIIPNRDGQLGCHNNSAYWSLQEYLEGSIYSWARWQQIKKDDPTFLPRLGSRIAGIHDILRIAVASGESGLSVDLPPIQFDLVDYISEHWLMALGQLERMVAISAQQSRDTFLRLKNSIEGHWHRLVKWVQDLGILQMPRQIVHGDISPVNMIFQKAGSSFGLIDWDCVHEGLRLYDALGDVLNRPPADIVEKPDFSFDEVRGYLQGYDHEAEKPLTNQEFAAVPAFCLARHLEDLRQRLAVLADLPAEQDTEYAKLIEMRVELMDQIEPEKFTF